MKKIKANISVLLVAILFISCTEKSTNPADTVTDEPDQIYQVRGCGGKEGLAKVAFSDSCLSYQFDTHLVLDFCVTANCCPDSNRFDFTYAIRKDTIAVAVQDTAENRCRCVCSYTIHVELYNLSLDRYIFSCSYYDKIVYLEELIRQSNEPGS